MLESCQPSSRKGVIDEDAFQNASLNRFLLTIHEIVGHFTVGKLHALLGYVTENFKGIRIEYHRVLLVKAG